MALEASSRAAENALKGLAPADLILLVESLRGALADLLRLHRGPLRCWASLREAEEVNLATMSVGDMTALTRRLRDEVVELAAYAT
jgi:hypothetical protein